MAFPAGDPHTITIEYEEYEKLKEDQKLLRSLEEAGVDNWEGYDYAMDIYYERNKNKRKVK